MKEQIKMNNLSFLQSLKPQKLQTYRIFKIFKQFPKKSENSRISPKRLELRKFSRITKLFRMTFAMNLVCIHLESSKRGYNRQSVD